MDGEFSVMDFVLVVFLFCIFDFAILTLLCCYSY
jgi:hypothetical protein